MPASELDLLMRGVQKPARYAGGEWNAVTSLPDGDTFDVVLCHLDGYEVGMGSRELQWLYRGLNETPGMRAERAFLPAADMKSRLRSKKVPLHAVESKRPLHAFPVIVLLAQREAQLLNVAEILSLSGLRAMAAARDCENPLIVAAGAAIVNWEPVAELVDVALLGDPDESLLQLIALLSADLKRGREEVLASIAEINGTYVPSLYTPAESEGDGVLRYVGGGAVPELQRLVCENVPCVASQIVPHMELDRDGGLVDLERCRNPDRAGEAALELVRVCGYHRIRLLEPPDTDYVLCQATMAAIRRRDPSANVDIVLPPLQVGFAEGVTESRAAEITAAAEVAFRAGWTQLTLLSVAGYPECDKGDRTLIDVVRLVLELGQRLVGRRPRLRTEIVPFVPRAGTQDERLSSIDSGRVRDQMGKLKKQLRKLGVHAANADPDVAVVEAVISRSGRGIAKALIAANEAGCVYDGREGHLDLGAWEAACAGAGFDASSRLGAIDSSDVLPWAHLGRPGRSAQVPLTGSD